VVAGWMFCHWRKVMVTRVFNCRVGCRVFSSILWVIRWVSDESQEDLPKFSYRWESTFLKFRIPAIFWLHVGTYCPNMVQSFPLQIWKLWPCFPKKKILCKIGTFFFHQVQELVPSKKTLIECSLSLNSIFHFTKVTFYCWKITFLQVFLRKY